MLNALSAVFLRIRYIVAVVGDIADNLIVRLYLVLAVIMFIK